MQSGLDLALRGLCQRTAFQVVSIDWQAGGDTYSDWVRRQDLPERSAERNIVNVGGRLVYPALLIEITKCDGVHHAGGINGRL